MKVELDPNCILPDDMTQDELDSMIKEFQEMVDNGTLDENSEELSEEDYQELLAAGYITDEPPVRH